MQYDEHSGWWLPDGEAHLQDWMRQVNDRHDGRLLYQGRKYRKALEFVPEHRRRVAIDIGAHVGLWSWQMTHDFAFVHAFEPIRAHRECFTANVLADPQVAPFVDLHGLALGNAMGKVTLAQRTPDSSGDTGVDLEGNGIEAALWKLDAFDFQYVDLMKVDCEGYELFVLKGAVETLKAHKPCVIVEQKPETGGAQRYGIGTTDAVHFLQSLGAVARAGIQGDYILSWE